MRLAEEPLTKVTINLFTRDVEDLRKLGKGWHEEIRAAIRIHVNEIRRRKAARNNP